MIDPEKYTDLRVDSLKTAVEIRLDALDKATALAACNLEKKLDSLDVDGKFVPRSEFMIAHDKVLEDIKLLREDKARLEGKASQGQVYVAWIFAAISLALSAVAVFT